MQRRTAWLLWLLAYLTLWQPNAVAQYSEIEEEQSKPPAVDQSGPQKSVGETVVVPRKRPTPPPEPRADQGRAIQEGAPIFRTEVELVNVSVVVRDKDGNFIPGLKKEHFRVQEDGAPQQILRMETSEAPMTIAMIIEFSDIYWEFLYDTLQAAYGFVNSLRPEDWVAVVFYDIKTQILLDFTRNKAAAYDALNQLRIPGFSESNLFDALAEVLERMEKVEGRKAILLISSGVDTFSRTRYDKVLDMVRASETPIYAISTGQAARLWYEGRGYMSSIEQMNFLQADNQLRSFARLSGGRAYFPRFEGSFPGIYGDISASLRNEYTLSYRSTNTKRDGKFRKLKVALVGPDGKPLKIVNEKGKELKYEIQHREGYSAPRPVE
ncbi:MAG: VWA domain-containing protein [Acidobacteria bacterium]|nr:VWA domain-containing protein [Acidobacteriota bacterium]